MPRPKIHFTQYDDLTLGILANVAWGRITPAEAQRLLGMPRWTVARLCKALYARTPEQGRNAYLRKIAASAEGTGRRPLTKAQLRSIAETPTKPPDSTMSD